MLSTYLHNVRKSKPLVHNITNYVTVNDVANTLLALGASPIMADSAKEVADITSISQALNINIGTLNQDKVHAMIQAGKKASELKVPIVFDPVGVGASDYRTQTAEYFLKTLDLTVIKGNASEIKALANGSGLTQGVDASVNDQVTDASLQVNLDLAKKSAQKTGAIVIMTGPIDLVTDGDKAFRVDNGHPMMGTITGTGCILSAITAAFVGANPNKPLEASLAAVSLLGLCGQLAYNRLSELDGNATYRQYLIDAIYQIDQETFDNQARYKAL